MQRLRLNYGHMPIRDIGFCGLAMLFAILLLLETVVPSVAHHIGCTPPCVNSNAPSSSGSVLPPEGLSLLPAQIVSIIRFHYALGAFDCYWGDTCGHATRFTDPSGASFGLWHDWQGRPRVVKGHNGVVASDHGRCAELGADVDAGWSFSVTRCVCTHSAWRVEARGQCH